MDHNFLNSPHMQGKPIEVVHWKRGATIETIIDDFGKTGIEARNISNGAKLFRSMIGGNDTIWFGIAGIASVIGLGGYISNLIEAGFIDVICSTGAQLYHDLHFAYGLPVVQGSPQVNDNELDADGVVRIYDTYIGRDETLIEQDKRIRAFAKGLRKKGGSSADYNFELGKYVAENAPHPEKSLLVSAAKAGVPVFWDSESNHSLAMNNAALYLEGKPVDPSPSRSLLEASAINYHNPQLGFFELGGGGPKNWIQTIAPMISQILGIEFEGADRGIQITTAVERDAGLSSCSFREGVTWGKYKDATKGLVQIWGEYSYIFPLMTGYVLETCTPRSQRRLMDKKDEYYKEFSKIARDNSHKSF